MQPTYENAATGTENPTFHAENLILEHDYRSPDELAMFLTGLDLHDPALIDKLISDKEFIRHKYNLPPLILRTQEPDEYERTLKKRLRDEGINFRDGLEMGEFFAHNPSASGVFDEEENIVAVKHINRNDFVDFYQALSEMEHELIHALQHKYSPRMPIELMEYEAYLGANFMAEKLLESDADRTAFALHDVLFGNFCIMGSVNWWYSDASKSRGVTVSPEWSTYDKNKQHTIARSREFIFTNDTNKTVSSKEFLAQLDDNLTDGFTSFITPDVGAVPKDISLREIREFDLKLRESRLDLSDLFIGGMLESGVLLNLYT
jgi:hypothetical protein